MIKIENLHKAFGPKKVLSGVDLEIHEGEFLAIIGRSGEGKSVLLKNIIGLLHPDEGKIFINNEDITMLSGKALEDVFKQCGYVFQFAALLDSLNIFENVGITLLEQNASEADVYPIVVEKIKSVGLAPDILDKYPDQLSGGMKKRVGLARTLMLNPKVILYDEPTTGLDPIMVGRIHKLIKAKQEQLKATSVVISHDIDIFKYADRVAMLYEGKIVFIGAAKDIWESKNPYVYQFIRGLSEGPIKPQDVLPVEDATNSKPA